MRFNCVRVYNNGEWRGLNLNKCDTALWQDYNRYFRPGCAIFIDGQCVHRGYLTRERCAGIAETIQNSDQLPLAFPLTYEQ